MKLLIPFLLLLFSFSALSENLGRLELDELILAPRFDQSKDQAKGFSLGDTLFSVRWQRYKLFSSKLSLSSKTLVYSPFYFSQKEDTPEINLAEAYVQYKWAYGEFKLGLQPIGYGVEGQRLEGDRFFDRSLAFKKKLFALYDFGLSYQVAYKRYSTRMLVHNGEGVEGNEDGRFFYTGNWQWENKKLKVLFSAQTGEVKKESLNMDTMTNLNLLDSTKDLHMRSGAFSLSFKDKYTDVSFELYRGQLDQEGSINKWHGFYGDLRVKKLLPVDLLLRADYIDPKRTTTGDIIREFTLGLALVDWYQNSKLIFLSSKVVDSDPEISGNSFYVVWRVQPRF